MIVAKLAKMGAEVKSFSMDDGSTVGDLFALANEAFVSGAVSIGGCMVDEGEELEDNAFVFIGRQTKGNLPFELQIIRLGAAEPCITIAIEEGTTVVGAINSLDATRKASFIRADGTHVYQEYRLKNGVLIDANAVIARPADGSERICCATKMKGNE
jgi:hypothetical protein